MAEEMVTTTRRLLTWGVRACYLARVVPAGKGDGVDAADSLLLERGQQPGLVCKRKDKYVGTRLACCQQRRGEKMSRKRAAGERLSWTPLALAFPHISVHSLDDAVTASVVLLRSKRIVGKAG